MKLGFLTACMPERSLEDVAAWAGANGFEALELAAWPGAGTGPSWRGHLAAEAFDTAEAERVRRRARAATGWRSRRSPTTTTTCTPSRPCARPSTPICAPASTPPRRSAARPSAPSSDATRAARWPRTCATPSASSRRSSTTPGERGVRLMIENCVMEGWHPDGYPGNLAYSPELWEWMFALGLYLNFDPSHLLWLGIDPVGRAAALRRPRRRTPTPRTPRPSPSGATATASSAAPPPATRTRGTWAGGATASPASARSTSAATSTRCTRAGSTACCRSSTRTRCGAARPRRSSRACGSRTPHLRPLVVG